MSDWTQKDLGPIDAYALAVEGGYTGTKAEWIEEIANASTNAQTASTKASDAEAYAAGTRGGESVEETDPAYHNNANYYNTEAQAAKTEAQTAAASASAAYGTSMLAPNYSSESTYSVGQYVIYSGSLYKCISAITTAEAWTAAHWQAVAVGSEVSNLKSALDTVEGDVEYNAAKILTGTYKHIVGTIEKSVNSSSASGYTTNEFPSPRITVTEGDTLTIKRTITATVNPSGFTKVWARIYQYDESDNVIQNDNLSNQETEITIADSVVTVGFKVVYSKSATESGWTEKFSYDIYVEGGLALNTDISVSHAGTSDKSNDYIEGLEYATPYQSAENDLRARIDQVKSYDNIIFGIATDSHIGGYSVSESVMEDHARVYAKLTDFTGIDILMHLGDMSHEYVYDNNVSQASINRGRLGKYMKHIQNTIKPFIYAIGHHEMYPWNPAQQSYHLTRKEVWGMAGKQTKWLARNAVIGNASQPTYYYIDYPEYKTRLIITDSCDGQPLKWSVTQIEWIRDVALANVPAGYGVFVFGHCAPAKTISTINSDTIYNGYSVDGTPSDNPGGVYFLDTLMNASQNGVNIMAYIHGHTHMDNAYNVAGCKFPCISVCCDLPKKYTPDKTIAGDAESFDRTIGSLSEYCFDVFGASVSSRVIYIKRFGCGYYRRIWCEPYKCTVGGTVTLPFSGGSVLPGDTGIATVSGNVATGVSAGTTQVIYKSTSEKYICTLIVE